MKQLSISYRYLGSGEEISIIRGTDLTHEFPRHVHRTFCIGINEKGKRDFLVGGKTFTAQEGDLFFINPGVSHSCITSEDHSYRVLCCSQSTLSRVAKEIVPDCPGDVRFNKVCVEDNSLSEKGKKFFSALECREFPIMDDELFNSFLSSAVLSYADVLVLPVKDRGDVLAAETFIIQNLTADISLKRCADEAGLSPYYFTRLFTEMTGISPHLYIIQERVKLAQKRLLAHGEISRAAVESGFFDQSHLSRHFKRMTGCTPGEFLAANL